MNMIRRTYRALTARFALRSLRRQHGQAISEYAILLAFIAVLSVGFIAIFGGKVADVWESISGTLP